MAGGGAGAVADVAEVAVAGHGVLEAHQGQAGAVAVDLGPAVLQELETAPP